MGLNMELWRYTRVNTKNHQKHALCLQTHRNKHRCREAIEGFHRAHSCCNSGPYTSEGRKSALRPLSPIICPTQKVNKALCDATLDMEYMWGDEVCTARVSLYIGNA
jgi:hypothetical protein